MIVMVGLSVHEGLVVLFFFEVGVIAVPVVVVTVFFVLVLVTMMPVLFVLGHCGED